MKCARIYYVYIYIYVHQQTSVGHQTTDHYSFFSIFMFSSYIIINALHCIALPLIVLMWGNERLCGTISILLIPPTTNDRTLLAQFD